MVSNARTWAKGFWYAARVRFVYTRDRCKIRMSGQKHFGSAALVRGRTHPTAGWKVSEQKHFGRKPLRLPPCRIASSGYPTDTRPASSESVSGIWEARESIPA